MTGRFEKGDKTEVVYIGNEQVGLDDQFFTR